MNDQDRRFLLRVAAITLAIVLVGVVTVMLYGLFDPKVDNEKIFAMISPSFFTIVGCFVGVLGATSRNSADK